MKRPADWSSGDGIAQYATGPVPRGTPRPGTADKRLAVEPAIHRWDAQHAQLRR